MPQDIYEKLEAEADGWVLSILRYEGANVPVGETIAHIGDQRETKPARRPLKTTAQERTSAVQARHSAVPEGPSLRAGFPPRLPVSISATTSRDSTISSPILGMGTARAKSILL